jgi:hypothetical protein
MASIAEAHSLFEIDVELDGLLEEIEEQIKTSSSDIGVRQTGNGSLISFSPLTEIDTSPARAVKASISSRRRCRASRLAILARTSSSLLFLKFVYRR